MNGAYCEKCPFKGSGCAGTHGLVEAGFVVVGEAPGGMEVQHGVPFVGPSGDLLWSTLARAGGPPREEVFATNALSCKPPYGIGPTRDAIDACRNRVSEEVGARQRRVVLACGNSALRSLTGKHHLKIGAVRGTAIRVQVGGYEQVVVPTIHPAAVLRAPAEMRHFEADVRYAVEVYNSGEVRGPGKTEYTVIDSEHLAKMYANVIQDVGLVGADIETDSLNPRTGRVLCMGVALAKNSVVVYPAEYIHYLHDALANPAVRWVWHNGKFDTAFLRAMGLPARVDEDTMLLHYCLDEYSGGHGLKEMACELLGAEEWEDALKPFLSKKVTDFVDGKPVKRKANYGDIPLSTLYKYLAYDCDYTLQLYHLLTKRVEAMSGLGSLYHNLLIPASAFLQTVEQNGLLVDRSALDALRAKFTADLEAAKADLWEIVKRVWEPNVYARDTGAKSIPKNFNPASPQQMHWVLYNRCRVRVPPGVPRNTSKTTLERLPNHPIIPKLLAVRKANKMLSTYVTGIEDAIEADGRVHTTYLLHGTTSGRLSSREPNVQNIPRDAAVRSIFCAAPGRVLIECDAAGAELRGLGHLSGDPNIIAILNDPTRDLHSEVAESLFGPEFTKEDRVLAKTVTFGIMYGRTGHGLSKLPGVTVEQGNKMVEDWFERFPTAGRFLAACREAPLKGQVLRTPFGRRRRFPMITAENRDNVQREASNFPIQSLASDLTLISAMRLNPFVETLGGMIVNTVHDSILIEVPDDPAIVNAVATRAAEIMREVPDELIHARVRFEAEVKVGHSWGHMETWGTDGHQENMEIPGEVAEFLFGDDTEGEPALDGAETACRRLYLGGC